MSDAVHGVLDTLGPGGIACAIACLSAAVAALAFTLPVRCLAHRFGAVDIPGGRRIHTRPTARLGGLALFAAIVTGVSASVLLAGDPFGMGGDLASAAVPILATSALVCALGARDDFRSISPATKLVGLSVAGLFLVAAGVRIEVIDLPGIGRLELGWLAGPVTIIWVLACANAVNLIDGVDGAGTGVAMVSSAALALLCLGLSDGPSAMIYGAVCGATIGFLLYNRQPASIFLGDSGSLLLGFILAATSASSCTKRATALPLLAALLALSVPLLDSTQSFARRFRKSLLAGGRRRIVRAIQATGIADHGHIHHRLLSRGLSHRQVARVFCLVTTLTGLTALLLLPSEKFGLVPFLGACLAGGYMLFRLASLKTLEQVPAQPQEQPVEGTVIIPHSPTAEPVNPSGHPPVEVQDPAEELTR